MATKVFFDNSSDADKVAGNIKVKKIVIIRISRENLKVL